MSETRQPVHRNLEGEQEYVAAISEVIEKAQRTLHIFDIDLSSAGYQSVQRYEALRDFMVRSRNSTLVFVLHDTAYFERYCPRLMNLLKLYSHRISVLQTQEQGRSANDPFLIADEMHYVHRFHADGTRSKVGWDDHAGASALDERFQQLLETAQPAVSATTLGL
ncbi:ABC transporter ATP-binding protein [Novimethylophilus kurashikiensis]|uniref:ABC transporter ATP-binding protein n=1 Tax=Novimethylophilus kurashikiensis TaxID=1825523 RepID=A0A2R5F7V8_9PROT|nr:hypothetical protein [Novimethylophilus kurashikiensis]GBG14125.1 ABC transporter ATP-binding protein [Novimethylophilus kurashikiensis]